MIREAIEAGVTLTFVLAAAAVAAAAEVPPELLARLGDHEARIMRLLGDGSYNMVMVSEQLDGDGKVEHRSETVMRFESRDGRQSRQIVRATRDGKDVSAEERAEHEERERKRQRNGGKPPADSDGKGEHGQGISLGATTPFAANQQPKHRFSLIGPTQGDPNLVTIAFKPAGEPAEDLCIGEAVVDVAKGELVLIRLRPAEYPTFVSQMDIEMSFEATTPEGRVPSRVRVDGAGGVLFIKKRGRALITFSEYAAAPAAAGNDAKASLRP